MDHLFSELRVSEEKGLNVVHRGVSLAPGHLAEHHAGIGGIGFGVAVVAEFRCAGGLQPGEQPLTLGSAEADVPWGQNIETT